MEPDPVIREDEKDDDKYEEEEEEEEAPSHLPFPPPSELYDTSTTVDPSYIISLIRQLIPCDVEKQYQETEDSIHSVQGSDACPLNEEMVIDSSCRKENMANGSLEDLGPHRSLTDDTGDKVDDLHVDQTVSSTSNMDDGREFGKEEIRGSSDDGRTELLEKKDPWEDSGCILWDLSASTDHAEFMVNNLLLEVLLASLRVSKSLRVTEISLGIIGNLACHDVLSNTIVSTNGLIEAVVEQLFLDDSTCLSETFRLLTAGLQGSKFASWAEGLLHEQILLRIIWITGNTLNSVLLEKSIEFLSTIINNQEVSSILLQPLIKLGLPNLVASLLAGEISKLRDENKLERSSALDLVLGLVEALSALDNYSQVIATCEDIFPLVCAIVKLPDKIEVANSCVSAVVIIANLLVDEQRLTLELSEDFAFLTGLLDIFPFVYDDPQARSALWSILSRLLRQVQENDISTSTMHQFASLFAVKSHLIEEDIDGHPVENFGEFSNSSNASVPIVASLRSIAFILEKWILKKPAVTEREPIENDAKHYRFINYCRKFANTT